MLKHYARQGKPSPRVQPAWENSQRHRSCLCTCEFSVIAHLQDIRCFCGGNRKFSVSNPFPDVVSWFMFENVRGSCVLLSRRVLARDNRSFVSVCAVTSERHGHVRWSTCTVVARYFRIVKAEKTLRKEIEQHRTTRSRKGWKPLTEKCGRSTRKLEYLLRLSSQAAGGQNYCTPGDAQLKTR